MTTVLVPFDGSNLARRALEFACEKFGDDKLEVLFVVDTSVSRQPEQYIGMHLGEIYEKREEEGEKHLEEAEMVASTFETEVDTVLERGEPANRILERVEEQDVDHVVMGSQSKGILEQLFLGSVAERVVERSPASVTVVRS